MDIIDELLDEIVNEISDFISDIKIEYNSETFNLKDPNEFIIVEKCDDTYTSSHKKSNYIVNFTYKNIHIQTHNIHILYVIMQYVYGVTTILELSKLDWDYTQWNVKFTSSKSEKQLSCHMTILQHILNLPTYGVPMKVRDLDNECPLTDARGWSGERSREVYCKLGFPLMTNKTLPNRVKPKERVVLSPFPTELINPNRVAIIIPGDEHKCFTCGVQEGDLDKFGKPVKFEHGHMEPHISGGSNLARHQCKWCNTFYKDKITWNVTTNKPEFNLYAIIRDAPRNKVLDILKRLGYNT